MTYIPKIGLTMRLELATRRFYLGRDYSEAIEAAGSTPVHISLIPKREYIEDVMCGLDGLLLPGSDSDVDPSYYGEEPHPQIGTTVPEKDETDLLALECAERLGIPVLGICFGMQSLNVSRGGSLIQDIDSQVENALKHRQGPPLERNSHFVSIEEGTRLGEMVLENARRVKVNSHHHQAIRYIGNNLKSSAYTSDGVIEAIEDTRDGRFVVGVQWHPELSWDCDPLSAKIFETFVAECYDSKMCGHQQAVSPKCL
ncbi:MAG: gamma-glutamyl-gamma-aminobutyrate hydrolase family protein [Pyrinomonadaceae bacterium]